MNLRQAAIWIGAAAFGAFASAASAQDTAQATAEAAPAQDGAALTVAEIDPDELKAAEIRLRQYLRGAGYSRIQFNGLVGGGAVQMRACAGTTLTDLVIDRFGRVALSTPVGECEEPGFLDDIFASSLSDQELGVIIDQVLAQGYTRVDLLDDSGAELDAAACRGIRRYALEVDPDGGVLSARRAQTCDTIFDSPDRQALIRRALQARGYTSIEFIDADASARRALACNGVRYFDVTFSADGAIQQRGVIGFCPTKLNFAALPPRPVGPDEIPADGRLEPQLCQDVISQMIYLRPINFEFAEAELTPESVVFLGEIAGVLARCPGTRLLVEGHTDDVGSDTANQALSLRRAQSVADALAEYGITGRAVAPAGFGEGFPIATNETDEGRAANRRIEMTLQWGSE